MRLVMSMSVSCIIQVEYPVSYPGVPLSIRYDYTYLLPFVLLRELSIGTLVDDGVVRYTLTIGGLGINALGVYYPLDRKRRRLMYSI